MFPDPNSRSAKLFERAQKVLAGGNTRFAVYTAPYQVYAVRGSGSRVVDVDGVERLDLQNNMTVLIHGHAHPAIMERVREQLERGTCFGLSTESEIALAEVLCSRVPSFDIVRFVNSGTEAVMTAMKAARAYTGRPKIAKAEGSYHGSYDYAEVSLDSTPENWGDLDRPNSVPYAVGTPQGVLEDVVVLPFNDPDQALRILETQKDELAGVLIDPLPGRFGLIPATPDFLDMVRGFTRRTGSLLIFDEVICFRLGYRGAQTEFECEPDLTALGKVVGGGFPIGVVAGRKDVMSVFDLTRDRPPVFQGGTFNANPVSMVAGLAAMELLTPTVFDRLNGLGALARAKMAEAFVTAGAPGQVTGMGSLFRIHTTDRAISDYRTYYPSAAEKQELEWLWRYLLNHGILITKMGMGALSTVTTEAEIELFSETLLGGLQEMQSEGIAAA
ncbi:MAG: aspartate aminotransferase family protein [Kiloniellaceae bacterium]